LQKALQIEKNFNDWDETKQNNWSFLGTTPNEATKNDNLFYKNLTSEMVMIAKHGQISTTGNTQPHAILLAYFDAYKPPQNLSQQDEAWVENIFLDYIDHTPYAALASLLPLEKFKKFDNTYINKFTTTTWKQAAYRYNPLQFRQVWHYAQVFWRSLAMADTSTHSLFGGLLNSRKQIAFVWYVLALGYTGRIAEIDIWQEWLNFASFHTKMNKKALFEYIEPSLQASINKTSAKALQDSIRHWQKLQGQETKLVVITNENTAKPKGKEIKAKKVANNTHKIIESIYIENAGLVLLSPYIPAYFSRLGLLESNSFANKEAQQKALYALQYLATAGKETEEYELALNKLLCGMEMGEVAATPISLTEAEQKTADGLLAAVIQQWTVMQNATLVNFRVSFLQRMGRLTFHKDRWELHIEPKAYDVLIDKIPWAFHLIKLAWMPLPLFVYWRNK
jgi:hypothetical protein